MAQATKAAYYKALKEQGVEFDQHYRDYDTATLKDAWETLAQANGLPLVPAGGEPETVVPPRDSDGEAEALREQLAELSEVVARLEAKAAKDEAMRTAPPPPRPKGTLDSREHAGVTLNSAPENGVLRVDEHGNKWFQNEVTKPSYPKPRGRRVLRYTNPGVKIEQVRVGEFIESFEIADDSAPGTTAEIKITLPSFQTGIYKAPNMPFKIHTYNGNRGFNMEDVDRYYGGRDLVPDTIKRTYVSNDMCYDIQSTIRTIENEYRERVLRRGQLT